MKTIITIIVLLFSVNVSADLQSQVDTIAKNADMTTAKVIVKSYGLDAIAVAAVGAKSGKAYIFIHEGDFDRVKDKTAILVHEMAHVHVQDNLGKASLHHGKHFKEACKMIAEANNTNVRFSCKAK